MTSDKRDASQPDDAPTPDDGSGHAAGEAVAWSALSSLLAGFILWGALGWGADTLLHTGRVFTSIGVFVGFGLGMYIVYVRFGRGPQTPPDDRSRN